MLGEEGPGRPQDDGNDDDKYHFSSTHVPENVLNIFTITFQVPTFIGGRYCWHSCF